VPAKNFGPVEIVRSAERCLRAAQLSGGNCFMSIEAFRAGGSAVTHHRAIYPALADNGTRRRGEGRGGRL
jgi:hypothetical protein